MIISRGLLMKNTIIFIDCGDTLVDESTQVWQDNNSDGILLRAELFEGAQKMMHTLHERGYRIALVADGRVESFANITKFYDLDKCFEAKAISEAVGCCKPDRRMFDKAMQDMGLTYEADSNRILMVGNNLKRDILGANKLGIISVLIDISPRYNMVPENEDETPDFIIHKPLELIDLVEKLESRT